MVQGLRKETPKSTQGAEKEIERYANKSNKSQNYVHANQMYANPRLPTMQRPANSNNHMIYRDNNTDNHKSSTHRLLV